MWTVLLMQTTNNEPDIIVNPLTPEEEKQVKSQIQDAVEKSRVQMAKYGKQLRKTLIIMRVFG